MSSTGNRSIATSWRKNSMMSAIAGISRMELAWVVLLQILGEDGICGQRTVEVRTISQRSDFFQIYWERSTHSFCIESTLLASFDRWNLSAHPRPSGYRPLQFNHVRVEIQDIRDLSRNDGESLQNSSLCISFSIYGHMMVSLFFSLPKSVAMMSSLLQDIILNSEKVQCPLNAASAGFTFFQEMPASATKDALIPIKKAFFALRFRICLARLR